jgi:hypothetical protein
MRHLRKRVSGLTRSYCIQARRLCRFSPFILLIRHSLENGRLSRNRTVFSEASTQRNVSRPAHKRKKDSQGLECLTHTTTV